MAVSVGTIVVDLKAEVAKLSTDMNNAAKAVTTGGKQMQAAADGARFAMRSLGAVLGVGTLTAFATSVVQSAESLEDMAQASGSSVEAMSKFVDIAKIGGGTAETVSGSITALNRALLNPAAEENKGVGAALKAFNLNAKDLLAMPIQDRVEKVAVAFNKYADGAAKGNYAQLLFKRSAQEVVPWLNDVAENLGRSASLTTQQAAQSRILAEEMRKLTIETSNWARALMSDLAPAITAVLKGFREKGLAGGLGVAEAEVNSIQNIEEAWRNAFKEMQKYGSDEAAPWLVRKNYEYWKAAVEAARGKKAKTEFVGPPSEQAGRPELPWTPPPPSGGKGNKKSALEEFQERIHKQRLEQLNEEGEEAQRLWVEAEEKRRAEQERTARERIESVAEVAEIEAYYATAGEEAAREYREQDDVARANKRADDAKDAADKAAAAWKAATDQITDSLTDALMRGFEGGKGWADNFIDTMKNMFATLVLRPIIQPIVQQGANMVTGLLGGGGGGAAEGGSMLGNALSMGSSLFGSGGLGGALMGGAGWLTGATTFTGALGAAGSLIGTGTGAGIASGLAMGAGALLPIVGAGLLAYSLFGKEGGGPKQEMRGGDAMFGTPGRYGLDQGLDSAVNDWKQRYKNIAQGLGGTPRDLTGMVRLALDPQGDAPNQVKAGAAVDGNIIYERYHESGRPGAESAQVSEELTRMLVIALRETDLEDSIDAIFDALDPTTGSTQEFIQALKDADAAMQSINKAAAAAAEAAAKAAAEAIDYGRALSFIAVTMENTHNAFVDSIETIRMEQMDAAAQYEFLDSEVARSMDVLRSLIDPTLIADYSGRARTDAMQAYGLLDAEQKKAVAEEFVTRLTEMDKITQERLQASADQQKESAAAIPIALTQGLTDGFTGVAEMIRAAIGRGITVDVRVDAPAKVEVSVV